MRKNNIIYTFTGGYESQVATSICSILENNHNQKFHFFAVVQDLDIKSRKKLDGFVQSYGSEIDFIDFGNAQDYFDFPLDTSGWHSIVLARLFIASLLPKEVDRVLYLDGDTLIRNDISELFQINMKQKTFALSIEPTFNIHHADNIGMKDAPYCNAGVMLIDLKKFRKKQLEKVIIDYYSKHHDKLSANDQDVINIIMKKDTFYLSPRYNFGTYYDYYPYRMFKKRLKKYHYAEHISEQDYNESRNDPIIIHFLGEDRPWRKGNRNRFRREYVFYKEKTPWKNVKDESGFEIYFLAWSFFNYCTKHFPSLRLSIINSLIPFMIKIRSLKLINKQKR